MSTIFDYLQHCQIEFTGEQLSKKMWERFGSERTVVVLDMSEFSKTAREKGIVYYLTLIQKMRDITQPLVSKWSGDVVRYEADNLFAVFTDTEHALRFLVDAFAQVDQHNANSDDTTRIGLCAGVDHGPLLLDGDDFFGDVVNAASKLGEDVARPGEVLVTELVRSRTQGDEFSYSRVEDHSLSDSSFLVHRLRLAH